MKKLIWCAFIIVCAAIFFLPGRYATGTETLAASDKPASEEPAAVQSADPAQQPPAPGACAGMQGMPMKGHGKGYGPGCGAGKMRGCGRMAAEGCAMRRMGGCGMAQGCGMMGSGCGMKQMHGCGMARGCGMMGSGYGMKQMYGCGMARNCGMVGSECGTRSTSPLTVDGAKAMVEGRLAFMRNPNLKMGGIADRGDSFEAEILTRDGSLVDKLVIQKDTGGMRSIY